MINLRLRPDTLISLEYSDGTPFGGPMTPKLDVSLRTLFSEIHLAFEECGVADTINRSERLLDELRRRPIYRRLIDRNDPQRVTPELLYPDPERVRPIRLHLGSADGHQSLGMDFGPGLLPVLHELVALLCGESSHLASMPAELHSLYRSVVPELERCELVLPRDSDELAYEECNHSVWNDCDATFIGHNTVIVRSRVARIVIDPWLFPAVATCSNDYRPVLRSELGEIDAVLITHSHPDHFDPATLLQFGRQVRVIVPKVPRETILSIDMAFRLREMGFEDVEALEWWEERQIGDIRIAALPFYGEQPTNSEQLCPEVRNMGNTYLVRTPRFSCAFIADSGRDRQGDVRDVALAAYRRWGRIDALFTGYRGWHLYPIQYAVSSVRSYLLFVPPELYAVRQSIMNSVSDAVDTAELWHARYLVPYADGGAPWFWEIGLGPVLSGTGDRSLKECRSFDPFPERCLEELRVRSAPTPDTWVGSPVLPLLLRPGQSICLVDGEVRLVEGEYHRWPWSVSEQAVCGA